MTTRSANGIDCFFAAHDRSDAPWNIVVEVRLDGSLDVGRLRTACERGLSAHVLARSSLDVATRSWTTTTNGPLPLLHAREDVAATRMRVLAVQPSLTNGVPAALTLAGDDNVLFLAVNHAASDGIGALALLRSIAEAYSGMSPTAATPEDFTISGGAATSLSRPTGRAVRLVGNAGDNRRSSGVVSRSVPVTQLRTDGATVNDIVLSGAHRAIERWLTGFGHRVERIGTLVPVDVRTGDPAFQNASGLQSVSTRPIDRSDDLALATTVRSQTSSLKTEEMRRALRRAIGGTLPAATGLLLLETMSVSNLGLVPAMSFGRISPTKLIFTPPVRAPCHASIGVASYNEVATVALRYSHSAFGDSEANELLELVVECALQVRAVVASTTRLID